MVAQELAQEFALKAGLSWDDKYHWYVSAKDLEAFMKAVAEKSSTIAWNKHHGIDGSYAIIRYFGLDK